MIHYLAVVNLFVGGFAWTALAMLSNRISESPVTFYQVIQMTILGMIPDEPLCDDYDTDAGNLADTPDLTDDGEDE